MANRTISNSKSDIEDFSSRVFLKDLLSKLCEKGSSCFGSSVPFFKGIALCGPSGCGKTFLIGELYQKCRELGYSCVGISPFDKKDEDETLSTVLGEMKRHPVFIWLESDPDDWGYFIYKVKAEASGSGAAIIITEFEDFSKVESKAKRFFTPFPLLLPSKDERSSFFKEKAPGISQDEIKALSIRTKNCDYYSLSSAADSVSGYFEAKFGSEKDINCYISVISSLNSAVQYSSAPVTPLASIAASPVSAAPAVQQTYAQSASSPVSAVPFSPITAPEITADNYLTSEDFNIDVPTESLKLKAPKIIQEPEIVESSIDDFDALVSEMRK